MSLPILVTQEKWQDLKVHWTQRIETAEDVVEETRALELAGQKKRLSHCLGLAVSHAKALEEGGRQGDAALVLGAALVAGGNPADLTADVMRLAIAAWSSEPWFTPYSELTGLTMLIRRCHHHHPTVPRYLRASTYLPERFACDSNP